MRYREFLPNLILQNVVECFWALEGDPPPPDTRPEPILPDGCVEVVLNCASPFLQHDDSSQSLQPRNFIVGQMTRPILISPTGPVHLIGIRFHPGGTAPFFRLPMHELTNQVIEFNAVAGKLGTKLVSNTAALNGIAQKVSALERLLTKHLLKSRDDFHTQRIANWIVRRSGMASVDEIARASGLSSRQLERRFLRDVGIGPKLLSRILRFQQVFRAVESNQPSWSELALDCGYYDQAHLIRDFRQFTRQTPSVLFAEVSSVTESFTRKNRASGFSNTP